MTELTEIAESLLNTLKARKRVQSYTEVENGAWRVILSEDWVFKLPKEALKDVLLGSDTDNRTRTFRNLRAAVEYTAKGHLQYLKAGNPSDYDRMHAWQEGIKRLSSCIDVEVNEHIMAGEKITLQLPRGEIITGTIRLIEPSPCGTKKRLYFK